MPRFNNGIVYTNENCIGCNRCVAQCSVSGANISTVQNGVSRIQVDSRKCTHCGKCISYCIHNARDFKDDAELFFADLRNNEKFSIVVDSSFYELYPDDAYKILGYLKSLGVEKVYDSSFGAEISVWGHTKYLKEHLDEPVWKRCFIAHSCSTVINSIENYHPELIKQIIPIHSPMMCTAIYARKYLEDKNKMAFIGPCVSKRDEMDSMYTPGDICYNVTFAHLMEQIGYKDFSTYYYEPDLTTNDICSIIPKSGTFKDAVAQFFPKTSYFVQLSTLAKETFDALQICLGQKYEKTQPIMAEVRACNIGCYAGPGIEKDRFDLERLSVSIAEKYIELNNNPYVSDDYKERWKQYQEGFADLNYDDFVRRYEDKFRQPFRVPEYNMNLIFDEMLKTTEEKRRINCRSCGYQSCHEMAKAIAHGYTRKENCIHYMQDEMTNRYETDIETGLPNHQKFISVAEQAFEQYPDKQFVVLCGDVNRLKVINDLYTYKTGSDVLKRIALSLKNCSSSNGISIVSSFGGGSFGIFMEYTPENMQKIYNLKYFDCTDLGVKFPVTIRFGVYIRQGIEDDINAMMNSAIICMDTSVSITQNTFTLFTKDFRERSLIEAEITAKMQPALDNGEFKLWFQPQYKVGSGKLVGAEALCRWIKDDGTIVSPGLFIPIAEKNGFIRILDKYIWRQAFSIVRSWLDEGLEPPPISVNISRISLENDALIFVIQRLGDEFDIPKKYIHFEITESAYMDDQQNLVYRINEIRKLGYKIAMDDFGSGYSSLNSLKDIPIDILKLDMGFMRSSTNIDKGGTIISAVVKMAQALNLSTVAEGVESEIQASFLDTVGCDIIQGFLYAKPMPGDKYHDLIDNK